MKISFNWLKDYVAVGISADELAYKLTMAGHEVETVARINGDAVFEMEITPNRSDCLCLRGMARETAAILGKACKFPQTQKRTWPRQKCDIRIEDKNACLRYIGTMIEGATIKEANKEIRTRLVSLGLRPINNVVDITNFCLMETGQPMHAFDYDKLIGGTIVVRRARAGEKIVTIDGIERGLDPSILVIADAKKPVAIAGIMGGKDTEVTAQTKNIFLESAYFDPLLIRRASRKLGLSSDSSYRFERGVDFRTVEDGSNRAIDLILQSAQGTIARHTDIIVPGKQKQERKITVSKGQINNLIGTSLTKAQCADILKKLDFSVSAGGKDVLNVKAPSFRGDIKDVEDIAEEISRIIGYDNVPLTIPSVRASAILSDPVRKARQRTKDLFVAQGFNEIITFTMISRKNLEMSGQDHLPAIDIFNPLTQDQEIMRPSMLPGFLSVLLSNANKGQKNLRFFETGKIYEDSGERDVLGILLSGMRTEDWRQIKKETADYYDLKGAMEQTLDRLGVSKTRIEYRPLQEKCFEDGQGAGIFIDGKETGAIGKIREEILSRWNIKQKNVLFAQCDMEEVYRQEEAPRKYIPVPEFPSISRDISLAVPKNVTAGAIEKAIRQAVNTQS
jgi:phenylalanyl-tRNA synthetase beta chain